MEQTVLSQGSGSGSYSGSDDDEISLIDLLAVLYHYRKMIVCVTAAAAVFALLFSLISIKLPWNKSYWPNIYTSSAVLLVEGDNKSENSAMALSYIKSNTLLDAVVGEFGLVERYKIKEKPVYSSRKKLSERLTVESESSRLTVSFIDEEPEFAQKVVEFVVANLTAYMEEFNKKNYKQRADDAIAVREASYSRMKVLEAQLAKDSANNDTMLEAQLQAQLEAQRLVYRQSVSDYETNMAKIESLPPVFEQFQAPEIPEQKISPSRGKFCIIFVFAAFFVSVFAAFLMNAVRNIRNDSEAMAKFRAAK